MEYDLYRMLQEKLDELDALVRELRKTGADYGEAHANYRIRLAEELVKLKSEGYAISLAGDIARGNKEIAQLKFLEISKEAIYKSNIEAINSAKLRIKLLDNQLAREFVIEK